MGRSRRGWSGWVTLTGATHVAEIHNGQVRKFEVTPEDFGLRRSSLDAVRGGDAAGNAAIIREVLAGQRRDEARALVLINSAAALHVGGLASDLRDAMALAGKSIDSGSAAGKLDELIRLTNAAA